MASPARLLYVAVAIHAVVARDLAVTAATATVALAATGHVGKSGSASGPGGDWSVILELVMTLQKQVLVALAI